MQKVIVCVDDEKSIAWGLQQQISRAFANKYLIEIAESGEEALEIVEEIKLAKMDLFMVITDQMMPGIKGLQLIKEINQLDSASKCILLTGYSDDSVLNQTDGLTIYKIMRKPWEFDEIKKAIEEADCPQQTTPNSHQPVIQ